MAKVTTYTVKSGDTLSEIAIKYYKDYGFTNWRTYMNKLAEVNDIENVNLIITGQKLTLSVTSSSTKPKTAKNTSNQAKITKFGLVSGEDNTLFAAWQWDKDHTDCYHVRWQYATGDGIWFMGSENESEKYKYSTYSIPSNATKVRFLVKPKSKKDKKVNGKETTWWTASWSKEKLFYPSKELPPGKPNVPSIDIDVYKLTVEVDGAQDLKATGIEFQIVKNDKSVFKTGKATIKTGHASYSCTVTAGAEYKVRCRAYRDKLYSEWTDYSENKGSAPTAPTIKSIKAKSESEVQLDWDGCKTATTYEGEYTLFKRYFDSSNEVQTMPTIDATKFSHAEVTGLTPGNEYFFRIRAAKGEAKSGWSPIKSIKIGEPPAAPTTWSSTTTAVTGEIVKLYWVHNSEDNSSETEAELRIKIDGKLKTYTIVNTTKEDEKDKTSYVSIDTSTGILSWTEDSGKKSHNLGSTFLDGASFKWDVRTKGIINKYGERSIIRVVNVYAPPSLELSIIDQNGNDLSVIESFPFYLKGLPGPETQQPIGYSVSITSNGTYETVDDMGNTTTISSGDIIYSKHFDTNYELVLEMSAGNIDLENNVSYAITVTVSMDSGLTATESIDIEVSWTDAFHIPNAEISIDNDSLTASIRPYCEYYPTEYRIVNHDANNDVITDETIEPVEGNIVEDTYTDDGHQVYSINKDGSTIYYCIVESDELVPVDGVTLAVYRREFDGSFTEIASGLDNLANTYVTDPHPALDYARYRIVATTVDTGAVSYYDVPGVPVGETAVIIQWEEDWTNFDINEESEELVEQPWSGSMLKIPYNVDVSDKASPDVDLVSYIGRKRPVAYYGTQLGESATWSVTIPKDDKETLYALRRLAIWAGNVYVREPSGSGYWANVKVSYSQAHKETTIPVSFDITRVEGGI